jgi:PAS domain S-box-containing protein
MKSTVKILIFETQSIYRDRLKMELAKDGITSKIESVATESRFRWQLRAFAPHLIVADHALPGCDGIAALAEARQESNHIPFIFICDLGEEDTALQALQQGATDYVVRGRFERVGLAVRRAVRQREERSERKRTAAAFEEMVDRYRAIFDRSMDCLYVHDFNGQFLDANPAALALLGYTREEIPTVSFNSLLSADQLPKAMECLEEVSQHGRQQRSREFNLKHRNGREVVVETQSSLILHQGKPLGVLGIARDMTERRQAELELRRINRLYAVLSHVNQILIRARTSEELLQQVCAVAVEHGGFQAARINRLDAESRLVTPVAKAGGPDEFLSMMPIYADDRAEGQGPTGMALREGKICVFNDVRTNPRCLPWRKAVELAGVNAAASFPIWFAGAIYGTLSLYDDGRNVFQEKEVALLRGVAEAVSSGLERLEEEARRKRAEESLKERDEAVRKSDAR